MGAYDKPVPTVPTNARVEVTEAGLRVLCDRDCNSYMTTGVFEIWRASTFDGTYKKLNDVNNPASGDMSYTDVSLDSDGVFYKIRKRTANGEKSKYAGIIQFIDASNLVVCRFNIRSIIDDVYSNEVPKVYFELENSDDNYMEEVRSNQILLTASEKGVNCEKLTGYGEIELMRSSFLNDSTYKITVNIGKDAWEATGVTINGAREITLNEVITYWEQWLYELNPTFTKQT